MPRSPKRSIRRVAVLGSGKVREKDPTYQQAARLGQALAREGFGVCHGGYGGVMEAVAKGCRKGGGHNTGVTVMKLSNTTPSVGKAVAGGFLRTVNPWVDAEVKMPWWQSRLFKLVEMGDAYIFLDGATGTLAELFVVLEMTNRGLLEKPVVILGKRLHVLMKFLQKGPRFDFPPQLVFVTSVAQAIQRLKI